jgi:peroxiredoxin
MVRLWCIIVCAIFIGVCSSFFSSPALAAVSSCTTAVGSDSASKLSSMELAFSVINTSATDTIRWVKITTFDPDIVSVQGRTSNWGYSENTQEYALFSSGSTAPNGSISFALIIQTSNQEGSGSWTVEVSDDSSGANPTTCTGDTSFSVNGDPADVNPPSIGDEITLSDISDSSAKLAWTTNENATAEVLYGVTSDYGLSVSTDGMGTSHTITISGLTPNTTYHYSLKNTDSSGNSVLSDDNIFATSKEPTVIIGPSPTPRTVTVTSTVTQQVTQQLLVTPSPEPKDISAPKMRLTTDISQVYPVFPEIKGEVTDNKQVDTLAYSLDKGVNWLPIELREGVRTARATFAFKPDVFGDDTYTLLLRAEDSSHNIGYSEPFSLVIDRIPPQIGGSFINLGSQPVFPDREGTVQTIAGLSQNITLAVTGGPTTVDAVTKAQLFSLLKDSDSGLWRGTLAFSKPGSMPVHVRAVDGAGHKTERDTITFSVLAPGTVRAFDTKLPIDAASVHVYTLDTSTHTWHLWDGRAFGQQNPQQVDKEGSYRFILPAGQYYVAVQAQGYTKVVSDIFAPLVSTPLTSDFVLKPQHNLKIAGISLPHFDFFSESIAIHFADPAILSKEGITTSLIEKEAPPFQLPALNGEKISLYDYRGKPSVVSILSTWVPSSQEQIGIIDMMQRTQPIPHAVVVTQESLALTRIFKERGHYNLNFLVDTDGMLVNSYQLNTIPTHYFLDRKGIIKRVVPGVMSGEEIRSTLVSY